MPFRFTLRLGACAIALLAAFPAMAAGEYSALLRDHKFAEADKAASARLAKEPANPDALVARSRAVMSLDDTRLDEAIALAQKCVAAHPANARCHVALGQAMGTKAMSGGMSEGLALAGQIRDAFKKAVELDPASIDARFALLDYYIMAPFVVGGGTGKAQTLARDSASISPELSKLMQAKVDIKEGNLDKAEANALAAKPGTSEELRERQDEVLAAVAANALRDKKFADAERVLREGMKRYPDSFTQHYFMARTLQDQGKHREAVPFFEQSLEKSQRPYAHYRMAKSLQAIGDKTRAASAFDRALTYKAGLSKNMRDDATAQLKSVRG